MTVSSRPAASQDELDSGPQDAGISVSVVVPVTERAEPLDALYEEYAAGLRGGGETFEFIFVVEPAFAEETGALRGLVARGEPIRLLSVGQALGEASLLRAGAAHSRGPIILTLPSYRRVQASALPSLVKAVKEGADVAAARRWPRRDSRVNRLQTRLFHGLLPGPIFGEGQRIHDVACGVRAMRREVLERIPLYGDFARFLPLFALRDGYSVVEVPAPQHEEDVRTRVYRPGIYLRRLVDVLGLLFLLRFTEKPLRFFGLLGSVLSLTGGLILAVLLVQRLAGQGIADRPLLLLGVLLLVLGVQAIALGLIGEIIVHLGAAQRPTYRVREDAEAEERDPT